MKVLAIDPGYGRCGVAVIEGKGSEATLCYSACIETPTTSTFNERLFTVAGELLRLIDQYQPDHIAIEELYFSNNQKTALRVAEIRGMIIYIAMHVHIPLIEYNPLAIKTATTGYGRATKEQVINMVQKLIHIPEGKRHDDEYDAIALGLTALTRNPLTAS